MTNKKKTAICLVGLFFIIPAITWLTKKEITLKYLSDNFFMFALFFLIVGGFILVLSSGFFDLFQKNMKHLIQLRKNNEPKEYVPFSQIFKKKPVFWFIIGVSLLVTSIILALIV